MSTLYVVSTPIGNLGDITIRALDTLKIVDIIAAEDTRKTSVLLKHYNIEKKLIAYHSQNEINSVKGILQLLDDDKTVALVSDAGTPCISDPGSRLVEECIKTNHKIVPIPGASCATALVSIAGNIGKTWAFEGFLPIKNGKREKRLKELLDLGFAFILYESPHRIINLLEKIDEFAKNRKITLAREISKIYEEILRGSAEEIKTILEKRNQVKGEFALLIHPYDTTRETEES